MDSTSKILNVMVEDFHFKDAAVEVEEGRPCGI